MHQQAEQYRLLVEQTREQRHLGHVLSLLNWDEQTYMPSGAAPGRSEQVALIAKLIHARLTDARFVDLVSELRGDKALTDDQQACVREVAREVDRACKVPNDLVAALSKLESSTHHRWIEARDQRSFSIVKSELSELLTLKREYADALNTGSSRYETLLDLYETGLTVAEVRRWFGQLAPELRALADRFAPRARRANFSGEFPSRDQEILLHECLRVMGFDLTRGRLDPTVHPFCLDAGYDDVRLTIRYATDDFAPALYATLHEAGHGLYEQGFLPEHYGTPLALYSTMAIHESQSRLWENMVGRSREFLKFLYPRLCRRFPAAMNGVRYDDVLLHVNAVRRGLNRVEADEVTYGLHVILRFELEEKLISGDLTLDDLPAAWNDRYGTFLGVTPKDDLEGVLQDIHWYIGHFGYFPTYLLGSCYAAQIFQALDKKLGGVGQALERGELLPIRDWLREEIHRHGRRYLGTELVRRATGTDPVVEPFLGYLKAKWESLPSGE